LGLVTSLVEIWPFDLQVSVDRESVTVKCFFGHLYTVCTPKNI